MLYQKYVQRSPQLECITHFGSSSKRPYPFPIILPLPTSLATANLPSFLWICCFRHLINGITIRHHSSSFFHSACFDIDPLYGIHQYLVPCHGWTFPRRATSSPIVSWWVFGNHHLLPGFLLTVSSLVSLFSIPLHLLSPQQPEEAY